MRHNSILLASAAMPRGVFASPRANADPVKAMLVDVTKAFADFRERNDVRIGDLQAAIDHQATLIAGHRLNGGSPGVAPDPEYSGLFASFVRKGAGEEELRNANAAGDRGQIMAAMSEGSATDGGYLAPTEWDRKIQQALLPISAMRRLASIQVTTVAAYSTLWNDQSWGTGWVGETATRPATSTAHLSSINFGHGEIYANAFATQRLLDDGGIDVGTWLTTQVDETFGRQEDIAFLSGDGSNKPYGFLQYTVGGAAETQHPGGTLGISPSLNATSITTDALVAMSYDLGAPYRQNASWLMSSATAALISKMKDGQGNYIWRESFLIGQPSTLLGRPVELDENMPAVAAGNFPIAFGDFRRGYVINDRMGTRVLRDPYTNKPFVGFYATKRVGGGVLDPFAIRLMKISAT